jgi:hypothetical protein
MTEKKKRELILEMVDHIMESYQTPDFTEFVTCTGGDIVTYRVYNDGKVVCK